MKKDNKKKIYKSCVKKDDKLGEMIYDPKTETTSMVCYLNEKFETSEYIDVGETPVYPIPPDSHIVKERVVLFPSEVQDYENEEEIINDIRYFIHKYLEISPFFEKIAPFYVLFTWIYDRFKELPYLRAIADYGQGKSRFLKVIGSVCYKPMFTVGATTPAPIFRLISQYKGTLILDEADYRFSDTNAEIIKILNNGFQSGMSILRCSDSKNNYDLQAFDVFCPKIVATRNKFSDKALESRFLVEYMDGKLTREDIPINLDDFFDQEALQIRNKCLAWRLKNYNSIDPTLIEHDRSIEPRLSQIIAPLSVVIKDEEIKKELRDFIREYNKELTSDRGLSFEAPILEAIINLVELYSEQDITMKMIAEAYKQSNEGEKELSARKIGYLVKDKLRINTKRTNKGYVIDMLSYLENIGRLKGRYGISEQVNVMNVTEGCKEGFKGELEELGYHDLPSF